MDTQISVKALRFADNRAHCKFYSDGSGGQTERLDMVAYSGSVIEDHWYWGNLVIDLSGGQFPREKYPILEDHLEDAKIAFTGPPTVNENGLCIDPASTVFVDTEESLKFRTISKQGFPYQSSIYGIPLEVEEVPEGQVTEVNGFEFTGPGNIWRSWEFMEASVCVFGWDRNTSSAAFRKDADTQIDISYEKFTTGGNPMSVTKADLKNMFQDLIPEVAAAVKEQIVPEVAEAVKAEIVPEIADQVVAEAVPEVKAEVTGGGGADAAAFAEEETPAETTSEEKPMTLDEAKAKVKELLEMYPELAEEVKPKAAGGGEESAMRRRLYSMEKQMARMEADKAKAEADAIWTSRFAASEIPVERQEKIKAAVSIRKFMKNGVLDKVKFATAVDTEVGEWEDMFSGFGYSGGGSYVNRETPAEKRDEDLINRMAAAAVKGGAYLRKEV
jgi:hypothetical protein